MSKVKREDFASLADYGVASKDAGNDLFRAQKFRQAIDVYDLTVSELAAGDEANSDKIALTCAQCKSNAALCALRLKKWAESLRHCDDALQYLQLFSPSAADKAKVFYRQGQAYEGLGKLTEAIASFETAVEDEGTPAMLGALRRAKDSLKKQTAPASKLCTCPLCGVALAMDSEEACMEHMSSCSAFASKFSGNPGTTSEKRAGEKKAKKGQARKKSVSESTKADAEADFFKPLPIDDPELKGAVNADGTPVSEEDLKHSVDLWNPKEVASVQAERVSEGLKEACTKFKQHSDSKQALEAIDALEKLLKYSARGGGGEQTHRARTLSTTDPFFQKHDECPGFRAVLLAVGYVQTDEILQFLLVEQTTAESTPEWAKDQIGMLTGHPTQAGARALGEAVKQLGALRTELMGA
jgi:tetratricopeptide (TPR) repeat protein